MKTRNRHGVLLLIVLALLAMFGVMAIAFVILTGQTRRGADAVRRVGQYDDQPEKILNQAALDVFRGSNNHQSPLQVNNLLENLYGNEWYTGNMTIANTGDGPVIGAGQLIQFTFTQIYPASSAKPFHPEQHLGAVLTMLGTRAAGCSTHIVGMVGTTQLQIAAFDGFNSSDVISDINTMAAGGYTCPCLINGTPYSGTGFGFQWPPAKSANAQSGLCYNNAVDGNGWEFALLPNHAAFPYTSSDPSYNANSTYVNWLGQPDPAGPGGANPDYTAPDYQNVFLALRLAQPATTASGAIAACGLTPIPSFHRPALVNYWMKLNGGAAWSNPVLQRKVMLRPLPAPYNPGIPPLADPVHGPWDVNNTGDGYPDSIWIDPGYEVRSTPDGRLYKPLVAILCVDLDGRLNLNAHGSLAQLQSDFGQNPNIGSTLVYGGAASPPAGALPRGQMGWGPADINLLPLFNDDTNPNDPNALTQYQQLLAGKILSGSLTLDGRYGESNLLQSGSPVPYKLPSPGYSTGALADDILSADKEFDYPSNYQYALGANASTAADPTGRSAWQGYGTPADLQGMMATGLDFRGQPVYGVLSGGQTIDPVSFSNPSSAVNGCYSALCGNWTYECRTNNPYELDLSLRQPRGLRSPAPLDNPFSVNELEPILRPYDRDAMTLPNRLLQLAPLLGNASLGISAKVTTESWDLSCPSLAAPVSNVGAFSSTSGAATNLLAYAPGTLPSGSGPDGRIRHFTDLLKAAVTAAGGSAANLNASNMGAVLPPDILCDIRLDINRPFGNGVADDNYGVVADPGVVDKGQEQMPYVAPPGVTAPTSPLPRMDFANSGSSSTLADPRQMLFRYLYVLGMILTDPAATPPNWFQSGAGTPPNLAAMSVAAATAPATLQNEIHARWIAQWAANVVSFRDRDSIMKPFAYDPNVLANLGSGGTWTPPAPSSDNGRHVVFSCERPELLLTETLAFHEKRTEVFPDATPPPNGPLKLLMQHMRPQGSLYIELYNPWSATEAPAAELYGGINGSWQAGVVLNQTTPQGHPVWRLVIPVDNSVSKMPSNGYPVDPDDPNVSYTSSTPLTIERSIYFTNPSSLANTNPNDGTEFWASGAPTNVTPPMVLLHNHYALVGPPSSDPNGTWLSKSTGSSAAQILLSPAKYSTNQNPSVCPVQVLNNQTTAGQNDLPVSQIKQPLPIVVDQASVNGAPASPAPRLSISEPVTTSTPPGTPYPVPSGGNDASGDPQYWSAPPSPAPPSPLQPPYAPLDNQPSAEQFNGTPVGGASGTAFGVLPACRVVHLQRLANPLIAYDPNPAHAVLTADGEIDWTKSTYNPYRTIDSMPIDLTVYNGWESPANLAQVSPAGSAVEPPLTSPFRSRQRGDWAFWTANPQGQKAGSTYFNNLWAQEWQNTPGAYPNANNTPLSGQMFPYQLQHTLAYLNYGYGPPCSGSAEYLGDPSAAATSTSPFPWLTWNNRPFCSPMELLLVPAMSSSQLLYNYNVIGNPFTLSNPIPNGPVPAPLSPLETTAPVATTSPYTSANEPFTQLLNFFHAQQPATPSNATPTPAQFYRILEYLRVPSRFVGTEVQVNPAFCGDGTGAHQFHPPYNRIPRYRDPGRINLNTLTDPDVWNGFMQSASGLANNQQAFNDFIQSRKGYGGMEATPVKTLIGFNDDPPGAASGSTTAYPTLFANPFRSFEGAHLVPLDILYQTATCQLPTTPGTAAKPGMDINSTLLRQDYPYANPNRPLFGFDGGIPGSGIPGSSRQFNNDQRNPYFRYQNLQRLGNLVTTRSNVFAVWITVGYFQVQKYPGGVSGVTAANQQFIYPDGYQIIGELGADTGEVKRHRAFYIFDRSIPMGYQRGHDNNVSNGILLSRMIE